MSKGLTVTDVSKILDLITYKDWKHRLIPDGEGDFLYQCVFNAPCTVTGVMAEQRSRKTYISRWSCTSEVVRGVYQTIVAAEMHELNENFRLAGKALYDPHLDVFAMLDVKKYDTRAARGPMSRPEQPELS